MNKLILISGFIVLCGLCNGQVVSPVKDSIKPDSGQVEKINKMPMDTAHVKNDKTRPALKDSSRYPKTMDDLDPDRPKKNFSDPAKPKKN